MSAPDYCVDAPTNEKGEFKDIPPPYTAPEHPLYPPQAAYPPGPQPTYPSQQRYPVQYHPQQAGYQPQEAYTQPHGGIVMTAPRSTVIIRNTSIQPYDYLGLAIFVTVCCCLPFGIVGIIKASEVKNRWAVGDTVGAQEASRDAKRWSMYGLITGIAMSVITVAVGIAYYTVGFRSWYGY